MPLFRDTDTPMEISITPAATNQTNSSVPGNQNPPKKTVTPLNSIVDLQNWLERKLDNLPQVQALDNFIRESVKVNEEKFADLETKYTELQKTNFSQERRIDHLERELRGKNLIIKGLPDTKDEDQKALYSLVCRMISEISDQPITPDVTHRLGEFIENNDRPVRVIFSLIHHRDIVYGARENLDDEYSITPDTPFNIRRDHAVLIKKSIELSNNGVKNNINFKKREISSVNGDFSVIHGSLHPIPTSSSISTYQPSTSSSSSTSKNGRGLKRGLPNPNFINSRNLRSSTVKFRKTDTMNSAGSSNILNQLTQPPRTSN